ncbi:MAG: hypothetical protein ACOVO1_07455, partial [Chitinophagaceae bacterium]
AFFWVLGILSLSTLTYIFITKNSNTKADEKDVAKNFNQFTTKSTIATKKEQHSAVVKQQSNISQKQDELTYQESDFEDLSSNHSNVIGNKKSFEIKISDKKISKGFIKTASNKKANNIFNNRTSFNDLRMMKIDRGETNNVVVANTNYYIQPENYFDKSYLQQTEINNETNTSESSVKVTTNNANNNVAKTPVKVPKVKVSKNLHYGLQWNILLPETNSYLDLNAKNKPLTIAIPAFWVSKELNAKSELGLQLNPYSQYTLKSNNVLNKADYSVSILQGSNTTPTVINYLQTRSLLKAMGVELTLKYTYKINDKFSAAIGVGNTWLNAAVVNDKLIGNSGKSVHDSLYGIAKGFKEWDYLKSSFIIGRVELLYQLKKMQVGVSFVKPMGNIYSFENSNSNPINSRLVLKWKIK